MAYKGLNIHKTKTGHYYVPNLHKTFRTLQAAKKAINKWEHKQMKRDKPW